MSKETVTTILALVFILIATPCFAKCKVGADVTPGDDSVWVVSCHSTDNGDWMLDSTGKVHPDDTKAIKKAAKYSLGHSLEMTCLPPPQDDICYIDEAKK